MTRRRLLLMLCAAVVAAGVMRAEAGPPAAARARPNILLFVPDGLRARIVDRRTAPALASLRDHGVDFRNSHSLFPTFTTANASAMATGHYFGDTGNFSNSIFTGFPAPATADGTVVPFLENDAVLGAVDAGFGGDYLNGETILALARRAGYRTAALGKLGPTLIFDHTQRAGDTTIVVDDATGSAAGIPLSAEMQRRLIAAGLPLQTPARGDNGLAGTSTTPGTTVPNAVQQDYLSAVATRVILPMFKEAGTPFVMVYWSRDPDGSQHNEGDSLNQVTPGINGPTSLAGIRNADTNLARLRQALAALGLAATTDVIVSADHGFSTVLLESATSPAARAAYAGVAAAHLPPGFVAIDLAAALHLPLFDPDNRNAPVGPGAFPKHGNGVLGADPAKPDIVVAANGGADLIYLREPDAALAARVAHALAAQDYVSAMFVRSDLGRAAGALPMSAVNLQGAARTPTPAIVVSFRSYASGCAEPTVCGVDVADTTLQQGQGMHGSFSRADTRNFQAAIGPDFKQSFRSNVPSSNADIGQTIAQLIGVPLQRPGSLAGRVLTEALRGGAVPIYARGFLRAPDEDHGVRTVLLYQRVGKTSYFDAAGTPGRTLGLPDHVQ